MRPKVHVQDDGTVCGRADCVTLVESGQPIPSVTSYRYEHKAGYPPEVHVVIGSPTIDCVGELGTVTIERPDGSRVVLEWPTPPERITRIPAVKPPR